MAAVASTAAMARNDPPFQFAEQAGPHSVGLKVVEQYDYSRTYRSAIDELGKPYRGERARPLQTLIWYPARSNRGKAMKVGDYAELLTTETSFGKPRMTARAKTWLDALRPTLEMSLWAVRDAQAAPGRFPLAIYSPSASNMSWENADLCEYLASHGYVVLATPSLGASTRDMTLDLTGINTQARDIVFLINYAQILPNADLSQVAVAGFSWGGIANLFAAARDDRIDALVALDGSMRYYPGLVKEAGDVHPEQMTIPLIYFGQGSLTLEEYFHYSTEAQRSGPNVLSAWKQGDLITVHMMGLTHTDHSSFYQRNEEVWQNLSEEKVRNAGYGRQDSMAGYGWMARYTRAFLDAYLKQDAQAMAFLKRTPAENGVPRYTMAVTYRTATDVPVSFAAFRSEVGRHGFDRAAEIHARYQKEKPGFKVEEGALSAWAEELIDGGRLPQAIEMLKLAVQLNPDSGGAHARLGEAYEQAGQKALAIERYKKALELNPLNAYVRRKLQALEN